MSDFTVNNIIIDSFEEVRFETGLVQSDFTVSLIKDGAISAVPVTITEIGSGLYSVSFTPNSIGLWSINVRVTAYTRARYQKCYHVIEELSSNDDIVNLQNSINDLQNSVDNLETDIAAVATDVDTANTAIAALNVDIANIETQIDSVPEMILTEPVATHAAAGNVADYINKTKKYTTNRVVISGNDYSVKEDDGVTEFEAGVVNTAERAPD